MAVRDPISLTFVAIWLLSTVVISVVTGLFFVGTLFGTAGLIFAFWGGRSLWRVMSARSVENVDIGSLGGRHEAVEFDGRARPADETLTAPLSGEECIAYQVTVEQETPSSRSPSTRGP
jgi:hypothetical protein